MKKEKKKGWWMNIKDKINLKSKNRFCPPHYLPHKLPIGKPIGDEACHYHTAKWRMNHHRPYCKKLKCKNYNQMMKEYNEYLSKKNI